jgi:hypothetical protein
MKPRCQIVTAPAILKYRTMGPLYSMQNFVVYPQHLQAISEMVPSNWFTVACFHNVVTQSVKVRSRPCRTALGISYLVQWSECFPKGQETEDELSSSKLMKYNYITKVVN